MDAIQLLESQHREVEDLFEEIEGSDDNEDKMELFEELADKLAVHASIEEHHFYPGVKAKGTEEILKFFKILTSSNPQILKFQQPLLHTNH